MCAGYLGDLTRVWGGEQTKKDAGKGRKFHQYPTETESHEAVWQEKVKAVAQKPVEEIITLKDRHREKIFEFLEAAKGLGQRAHSALKQFNAAVTALDINLSDYTREESRRVTRKLKEATDSGYSVVEEGHQVKVSGNLEVLEVQDDTGTEEVKRRLKEAAKAGVDKPLRRSEEKESTKRPTTGGKGPGAYKGKGPVTSHPAALPEVKAPEEPRVKDNPKEEATKKEEASLPVGTKPKEPSVEEYKQKLLGQEETKAVDPGELHALVARLREKERRRKERKRNVRKKRSRSPASSSDDADSDWSGSAKARKLLGENSD